jgi:hypothetical protein
MTGGRHSNDLTLSELLGLAGSISYLLANAQPHFPRFFQCLCLMCLFATFDGCATLNGFADLTTLGVAVDFIDGDPN